MSIKSIGHNVVGGAEKFKNAAFAAPKKVLHAPGNSFRFTRRVAKRTFFGAGERIPVLTKIPVAKRLFVPKVLANGKPAPTAIEPLTKKEIAAAMAATGLFMAAVSGGVIAVSRNMYGVKDIVEPIFNR